MCTGQEGEIEGQCLRKPAGTTFTGVWSFGADSGYAYVLSPEEYQQELSLHFAAVTPSLADELGSGDIILYGLATHPRDSNWWPSFDIPPGRQAFYAITSAIVTRGEEHSREVRVFVFTRDEDRWGFLGEILVRTVPDIIEVDRAWISGDCAGCYDYWERWEGSTP